MNNLVEGFFYGLYMDPDLLTSLDFNPVDPRLARLDNYALDLHGLVKIVPNDVATVWGMLIKLKKTDLDAMYDFETTRTYKAQRVEVITTDNSCVIAQCYNVPATPEIEFNKDYFEKLIAVAKKMGLPANYIQLLESMTV